MFIRNKIIIKELLLQQHQHYCACASLNKMSRFLVCLLAFALSLHTSNGHTYNLGNCPIMEPMPGFNMNSMLGIWYVIQKTSTASFCITYNFTKLDEPDHYLLEQTSQHFLLGLTPFKHEYHYTGQLKVPNPAVPGHMTVKFPLNPLGSAAFIVYMTDYENYAGIFSCQSFGLGHRRSATILSRSRSLDKVFVEKARTRLASNNVDPFELSIISQKDCPKPKVNETHGVNININPNTFSSENIAGAVRTAGEKIGDGIEYVATGAKKVYKTLAERKENMEESGGKIKSDVEIINIPPGHYKPAESRSIKASDETSTDVWLP